MSFVAPAKFSFLKHLKCAYTGKEVEVRMIVSPDGKQWYFAPDATDSLEIVPSSNELFDRLSWRGGVHGAAVGAAALVCPYTGNPLVPEQIKGVGFRALGGFSPSEPMDDPAAFARAMLMRGGVVPKNAPTPGPRNVSARPRTEPEIRDGSADFDASDVAAETADRIVHAALPKKVRVTKPGGK